MSALRDSFYVDYQQGGLITGTPTHVVGKNALGIDDPAAAKQAVIDAFQSNDAAALKPISEFWNTAFDATSLPDDPDLYLSAGPFLLTSYVVPRGHRTLTLVGAPRKNTSALTSTMLVLSSNRWMSSAPERYDVRSLRRPESPPWPTTRRGSAADNRGMSTHFSSYKSDRRRVAQVVTTVVVAGLLLSAATGCSSDDDGATPGTSITPTSSPSATVPGTMPAVSSAASTSASSPISSPPATSAVPPTSAAPPATLETSGAHQALLTGILDAHHAAGEFVGARIALLDDDGTITEATAGTTTVDPASGPVDLDVAWNIGSVTKTFVAVVVLQLAEEGRLDLDAGIDRFLPDLAGAGQITPRQLLQHTSGLGEYGNQPAVLTDAQREWTPSELIAVAEAAGRTGEPGSPHHYSNTNYIVLGEIIEQVTGNPWADEVRTRIVEPLGMTNTSAITDERPIGYKLIDGSFVDTTFSAHPSLGGATGSMQSVGRDLLLFAAALRDRTLMSPGSQSAMQGFVTGEDYSRFGIVHGYGLGLEQYATGAITVVGHMGTGDAQSAFVGYDADHGTAVAVMTNTAEPGPQALMAIEALLAVSEAD